MFSIRRRLFLALKKVRIIKITPRQVPGKKISHSKISDSPEPLAATWKAPIYKTLCPLYAPPWGDSLLFTTNSWYSLNQSQKDERLKWPWNHPVVLNLIINLVITKYKLKSQYVKLTQLWPLTVDCFKQSEFSVLSGRLIKSLFPLHICRPNGYTIEISVLLQIQFCNTFTDVPSIIFKSCH